MSLVSRITQRVMDPRVAASIASMPTNVNAMGFDDWGFSPEDAKFFYSLGHLIYRYFRPTVHGMENLPAGRCLVVPNHSGQLPFDGVVLTVACLLEAKPPRLLRAMAERWFPTLPFVNEAFSRSGVVVGDPINCKNLLEAGNAILVFPEGAKGSGKTWWNRYKLRPFGRGFMRLALQTDAPVVPVAIIGAEESIISVHNARGLARALGMPYLPVSPLLPLLGPLAYLPLPTRFHIHIGEPMRFTGPFDDEDTEIERKAAEVRDRVQAMVDRGLAARDRVF